MSSDPTGAWGLPGISSGPAPKDDYGRQKARLVKATRDLESVFVGIMLKQMRKSMAGDSLLFGKSPESRMMQEMQDDVTAQQIGSTGSFGIATALYKSLEKTLPSNPSDEIARQSIIADAKNSER